MTALVFVRFFPKAGKESAVEEILRFMVRETRREPGCLRYDLYSTQGSSSARIFCLNERYADAKAQQAHRETAHYRQYREKIADLLEQPIEVSLLEPLDEH